MESPSGAGTFNIHVHICILKVPASDVCTNRTKFVRPSKPHLLSSSVNFVALLFMLRVFYWPSGLCHTRILHNQVQRNWLPTLLQADE